MELKKIIDEVVAQSQLNEIPTDIQPARIFTWDNDLSSEKDWDDFIGGQLVAHTYWDKKHFKAMIDVTNLTFGNTPTSYWGQLDHNDVITLYTNEFIDLNGKFVSIGEDTETKYMAMSYELQGFSLDKKVSKEIFYGKIMLVNVQRFLDNQFNDGNEAPIINIATGKLNEEIIIPSFKQQNKRQPADPSVKHIEAKTITTKKAHTIEILLPSPAVIIGGGFDFISNEERKGNASPAKDKRITVQKGSTKPKTFPINPFYAVLPTQWNIPSIDNYGFTHPADRSNVIKTLLATQAMGSVAQTGISAGTATGILGSATSAIGSGIIGLGQKYFGDKGTLANSTAINSSFLSGEGDPIKFFIQGDGVGDKLDADGYINLRELQGQNDYLEVNQANGEFGKYGKSMSPSNNGGFDTMTKYRAIGLDSIEIRADKIPALATPFAGSGYENLVITDKKIDDLLKTGAPRQNINSGDILKPMVFPEGWDVYVRNMFFRPDPYSFWNYPCLMPAEIGVYDVKKTTSIAYDVTTIPAKAGSGLQLLGLENDTDNGAQRKDSYWNKTIEVRQLTENDLYDPNKTFSSFRFEFADGALDDLFQIQLMAITSSTIRVKLLDENDEIVREHNFNSQGKNVGTSASWGTVVQV